MQPSPLTAHGAAGRRILQCIEAAQIDGRMPSCEFEFTSLELLYQHRFAPFLNLITPQAVP